MYEIDVVVLVRALASMQSMGMVRLGVEARSVLAHGTREFREFRTQNVGMLALGMPECWHATLGKSALRMSPKYRQDFVKRTLRENARVFQGRTRSLGQRTKESFHGERKEPESTIPEDARLVLKPEGRPLSTS